MVFLVRTLLFKGLVVKILIYRKFEDTVVRKPIERNDNELKSSQKLLSSSEKN